MLLLHAIILLRSSVLVLLCSIKAVLENVSKLSFIA